MSVVVLVLVGCSTEQRYQRILESTEAPGGQLSVIEASGGEWSGSTGVGRPDEALTIDDALVVGSNTKMVTAAVVLQLVEEGRLSLDDAAAAHVPQLDPAITVRSLLQHTSGLGEYSEHDVMVADDAAQMGEPWEPEALITLGQELATAPDGDAHYANTNFVALGLLIEAIEGQPLDVVFDERIFDPLGLEGSGLMTTEAPAHLAWGNGGAWGRASLFDPSVGWAAGAVYATSADLARFLQAVFAGELYSAELLAEQLEPVRWDENDDEGIDLSYGLGMIVADIDGAVFYGHQGGLAGYTSFSLVDPESGAVVADAYNQTDVDAVSPGFRALRIAAGR